ncbi:tripartite tricarboxylate transporter TctB family protein [Paenibacillus sp. LMG 31456]|uniref:Tripartite tricarboxylate transporter TctB family protein n=1 Tax=Paenibacillus foliorum TaxID=2654974 RepID=A0A972GPX4_9BACL|nr:tripartite tricarboxylate transporter TctB family protein [Paenibacillus foliorum]NOU94647.1 tripartite tricarboxylate transporter TctB family protein [Paenibacillus foliorum]
MFNKVGVGLGSLFLIVSGIIFWQSFSFDYYSDLGPGPGLFPRWLSASLMVLSVLYIASSLRGLQVRWGEVLPKGRDLLNVIMVLVAVVLFMVLLDQVGFIVAGSVMLMLLLMRSYAWYMAAVIAVGTSAVLYVAFSMGLDVPLPTGDLWDWMG